MAVAHAARALACAATIVVPSTTPPFIREQMAALGATVLVEGHVYVCATAPPRAPRVPAWGAAALGAVGDVVLVSLPWARHSPKARAWPVLRPSAPTAVMQHVLPTTGLP